MTERKWKRDPIAVEIHDLIEHRLEIGQERFGPWKDKDGITIEDTLEEAADGIIYTMRLLIKIRRMIQASK